MAGRTGNTYQVTVNTTPQTIGVTGGHGNRVLKIVVTGANSIYYGFSNAVTSSNGAIVKNTFTTDTTIETAANVYVVAASGTSTISVAEIIG